MNKVFFIGRLARDPEVRYTQSGKAVASFTVAVNRYVGGNKEADFIDHVAWEKLAETVGNNLHKGSLVLTEGRLQISSYEANDGTKRRVAEVVVQNMEFLERKQQQEDPTGGAFGGQVFPEEEIPF